MNYTGIIIAESLQDTAVLDKMMIVNTQIEPVTVKHQTPWLKQWTLHTVEISEAQADDIAQKLTHSLDKNNWYVDYKNDRFHYIIYSSKIFKVDRNSKEMYEEAKNYGRSIGIPEHQLDFV